MASSLIEYEARALRREHGSDLSDSKEIHFRAFRPDGEDERQMRELVFDNAFLGEPFDVICPCKEWFSDVDFPVQTLCITKPLSSFDALAHPA